MSFLKGILTDLRNRKLWPVPLVLIAAIVAVPVVLAKSPQSTPPPPPPPSGSQSGTGTPVAAVTVSNSSAKAPLAGSTRDPFTQQVQTKIVTAGSAVSAVTGSVDTGSADLASVSAGDGSLPALGGGSASAGGSSAPSGGSSSGGSTAGPSSGGGGSSAPAPVVPANAKPTPAPSGLTNTEAYRVALSVAEADGSVQPIDPLERLSALPSDQQPLIVELGVLQGGHSVLFAVLPGTQVAGPGTCTPGPIDCEILSLGQDQTETVSSGATSLTFAVSAITADQYANAGQANAARQKASAFGQGLLDQSSLDALSLFQYQPSVGAVVDLQNLTVGGN